LGRPVSLEELGFDAAQADSDSNILEDGTRYSAKPERSIDLLEQLADADFVDRPEVMASGWVSSTTSSVITGYMFTDGVSHSALSLQDAVKVTAAERIRATIRALTDLDFQFGGGHSRKLLLVYWKSEIVPTLRQSHSTSIRREIFGAAAEAAEVLGWSAYDAGRHGVAQRYFTQGLRLARESNDPMMGASILSYLSHQANYLGKFDEALHFARAAQAATVNSTSATAAAMFLAMEARALASIGDARGCIDALHQAEGMFERRNPAADPAWISYFDAYELAGEAAHCFRDLGQARQAQEFATQAVDAVQTPARTRAFIDLVNATAALTAGDLEEAVSLATRAVTLAGTLQSLRYIRYVSDFHAALTARHPKHSMTLEFADLVRVSHPKLIIPAT
jgi:tetratricopeptide (TPR) repeat protein